MREGRQEVHYRMLVGKALGKRPFGRPRWRVKRAPREVGYENVIWIKLGEKKKNRSRGLGGDNIKCVYVTAPSLALGTIQPSVKWLLSCGVK